MLDYLIQNRQKRQLTTQLTYLTKMDKPSRPASYLNVPPLPPTAFLSLTAESPFKPKPQTQPSVQLLKKLEPGVIADPPKKGERKSVFLAPFTPVGNCEAAPGLSPRL